MASPPSTKRYPDGIPLKVDYAYKTSINLKTIEYDLDDSRHVEVMFEDIKSDFTKITMIFDPENIFSIEQQKDGWQSILDNFKLYVEHFDE